MRGSVIAIIVSATDRAAVSLLFSLLVVERFVPFVLSLPGVLQNGAEDGLKQQDGQVDDEKGVHGPGERNVKLSISLTLDTLGHGGKSLTSPPQTASGTCTCSWGPSWTPSQYKLPRLQEPRWWYITPGSQWIGAGGRTEQMPKFVKIKNAFCGMCYPWFPWKINRTSGIRQCYKNLTLSVTN